MSFAVDDQIAVQPDALAGIMDREVPLLDGRIATLRALLAELGARTWTCGDTDVQPPFTGAGPWMRASTAIAPLQRLTAELAGPRHTDPDTLHGGVEPWKSAMARLEL